MKYNLHTHTYRCHHADGTDADYAAAAYENGLTVMGFSDHAPYVFENGYYSGYRMRPEEAAGYCESVLELREKYRGKMDILLGFEAEYYPRFFDQFLELIKPYPIDYLILGQHNMFNEVERESTDEPTSDPERLGLYVSQVIEAIKTGHFTYIAHPDMYHFTGDPEVGRREARRLCLAAKELNIPIEMNMLGYFDSRHYPTKLFWEVAGEVGGPAVVGCDAHEPRKSGNPVLLETGADLLAKHGLSPLPEPPMLRK